MARQQTFPAPGPARRAPGRAAAALGLALLAGCGTGFDAASRQTYGPSDGSVAGKSTIRLLNVLVVASPEGDRGALSLSVVNRGQRDDRLTGVTSPHATIELAGSGMLPAGGSVAIGSGTDLSATATELTRDPGRLVTLEFTFQRTESIRVRAVVVEATREYADLAPSEEPSDLPTSASPSPSS